MQYTTNLNLKKYELNDAGDPIALNENMDTIDSEIIKRASLVNETVPLSQLPVLPPVVTTTGSGSEYTATIDGITALTPGLLITIIPHISSATTSPTLNLNGFGEMIINRRHSHTNNGTTAGQSDEWLTRGKPQLLQYDGMRWVAVGATRPYGPDVYGIVGVGNGGTGKAFWTNNRLVYASDSSTLSQTAAPTKTGSVLRQNTTGAPYWSAPEDIQVGSSDSVNGFTFAVSDTAPTSAPAGRITFVYEGV